MFEKKTTGCCGMCDKWTMTRNLDFWRDITICTQDKIARSVFFNSTEMSLLCGSTEMCSILGIFWTFMEKKMPTLKELETILHNINTENLFTNFLHTCGWYQIRASPITLAYNADCRYYFHLFSCSAKFLFHHLPVYFTILVEPSWNANDEIVCEGHKVMFCRLFCAGSSGLQHSKEEENHGN